MNGHRRLLESGSTRSGLSRAATTLALVIALVVSACSGGGDSSSDAPDPTTGDSSESTDAPPRAAVTIEGETYTFSEEGFGATFNCNPNNNGNFEALLRLVDENDEVIPLTELRLVLANEGSDPDGEDNAIFIGFSHLDESSNLNYTPGWSANVETAERDGWPPGSSQISSYAIDGETASGTATFVTNESANDFARGDSDTVASVQGSFAVACDGSDVPTPPVDTAPAVSSQTTTDSGDAVVETATVTFGSDTYVFEESLGCTVDTAANTPVLAEFAVDGDRVEGDRISVRADQFAKETRVDLRIGNDTWIQTSGPYPVIDGGTATWDSIELEGNNGLQVVSITISC